MAENSTISWCDHTFNPWVGCTKVSAACDHCYAEGWAKRTGNAGLWNGERRRTSVANWRQPYKWNNDAPLSGPRQRVFCASLADVFDNQAAPEWRRDLFWMIRETPNLDWLLLTKRPQNIAKMLPPNWGEGFPNVWLGTTVENQQEADRRIPHLLSVPARIRFLSCEPLLGPINLKGWIYAAFDGDRRLGRTAAYVHWVIAGGESGGGARPMHPDWARDLRDQCAAAGVSFHLKQWGEWAPTPREDEPERWVERWNSGSPMPGCIVMDQAGMSRLGKKRAGRLLDGVQHDEFPA